MKNMPIICRSFLDDTSRCRLSFIPGIEGSDYINANYVDVCYTSTKIHRTSTKQYECYVCAHRVTISEKPS